MKRFGHYNENNGELIGWYWEDQEIPQPYAEISPELHEEIMAADSINDIIVKYINNTFIYHNRIKHVTWDDVRQERNKLLTNTDYTQVEDYPEDKKYQYKIYRQALRDLPQTYSNPEKVIWPIIDP